MIGLAGLVPNEDIEIRFTGLRPGEKLFEELRLEGEDISPTYHEKIKIFSGTRLMRGRSRKLAVASLEPLDRDRRGCRRYFSTAHAGSRVPASHRTGSRRRPSLKASSDGGPSVGRPHGCASASRLRAQALPRPATGAAVYLASNRLTGRLVDLDTRRSRLDVAPAEPVLRGDSCTRFADRAFVRDRDMDHSFPTTCRRSRQTKSTKSSPR